jgi:hypothetical protein
MHSKIKLKRHLNIHYFLNKDLELLVDDFGKNYNGIGERDVYDIPISELVKWSKSQTKESSICHTEPKKGGE